jgi:hypothetical protein
MVHAGTRPKDDRRKEISEHRGEEEVARAL